MTAFSITCFYFFDYFGGISYGNTVVGNVFNHDTPCTDGAIIPNSNPGKDHYAATNPAIVADRDRARPFSSGITLDGVGTVTGCVNADIRTDKAVVANAHGCFIKNSETEIGKKTLAHRDVLAIIAVKRLVDECIIVTFAQQVLEKSITLLEQRGTQLIIFPTLIFYFV